MLEGFDPIPSCGLRVVPLEREMSKSVIDEARETLRRTSPEKLAETRLRSSESRSSESLVPEDRVTKWKREMQELVDARELEKARMDTVQQLCRIAAKTKQDIAEGLKAVGGPAWRR